VLLAFGMFLGIFLGPTNISFSDFLDVVLYGQQGPNSVIIWVIRAPRVVAAILVGIALGVSGVMIQLSTRNPLGDPHIFGIAGGASVVQALVLSGVITTSGVGRFGWAVFGALLGSVFISLMSSRKDIGQAKLALIGISVSAMSVAVSVGILVHSRVFTQQSLVFISGSFANRGWHEVMSSLPFILFGIMLSVLVSGRLNILSLGDEIASNLGSSPERTRVIAIATAAVLSGSAVAIGGLIGFVGLLTPYIARLFVGNDSRLLTLFSAPIGAIVVLYADQVARLFFMPSEIPVGMVTTFIGAPLMIFIARRIL
jgi:iron complex transport system permease protein